MNGESTYVDGEQLMTRTRGATQAERREESLEHEFTAGVQPLTPRRSRL